MKDVSFLQVAKRQPTTLQRAPGQGAYKERDRYFFSLDHVLFFRLNRNNLILRLFLNDVSISKAAQYKVPEYAKMTGPLLTRIEHSQSSC